MGAAEVFLLSDMERGRVLDVTFSKTVTCQTLHELL